MNFELSQADPTFTAALKMNAGTANTSSNPQRSLEAGFAVARALVVLSVPFALSQEPEPASIFFLSTRALIAVYSLYAAGIILAFVTLGRKPAPLVLVAVHLADIFWACALAASIRSLTPALLLLVFPMLTATLRWGASATLVTTLGLVGLLEASTRHITIVSDHNTYLVAFQTYASMLLLGVLFAHIGHRQRQASKAEQTAQQLPSGTPAQIIQATFDRAFEVFRPRQVQLLVEESTTGRTFLWHSESVKEGAAVVQSEEFQHTTGDPYLRLVPEGDWMLRLGGREPVLRFEGEGPLKKHRESIPAVLLEYFGPYTTVFSAVVNMGEEWQGRFIVCDPAAPRSNRSARMLLKSFCEHAAAPILTAQVCLRACRDTAAEERARLARELHDGVIQSLLGVDLRLQSLRKHTEAIPKTQEDITEVQDVLRREALGLRQLVNDSKRRVLNAQRLLEYLSSLLERFQQDSGVVTRFFTDLDGDTIGPRICHEIARIVDEAVVNAHKHSRASTLTVRLGTAEGRWILVIVDDGIGFGFNGTWTLEKLTAAGLGPRVIQDRVRSLGGDLLLESTPAGTRLEISFPKPPDPSSAFLLRKRSVRPEMAQAKEEF